VSGAVESLRDAVRRAGESLGARPKAEPTLERPRQAGHGDYATNAAMLLAGALKAPPRDVAERLAGALREDLGAQLASVEVAGPGFLNLVLADAWFASALGAVLDEGPRYGAAGAARPRKVNLEFVSVNPTGPLHVGHARGAAYGEALARMLAFAGHSVHREYYVNDAGSQVRNFAASVQAAARGEAIPEDGYQGDYVAEVAAEIPGAAELELGELGPLAVQAMLAVNRATLDRFRVSFDTWFSEQSLHDGSPSRVQQAYEELERQGRTYRSEGALWLRTTDFGDDKDRVLERSSGEHTYFASDIAYHLDKRERGFELLIDVWGADHHGYMKRVHAAWEALGGDPADLELLIMQLVSLTEGGQPLRMSKRAGDFITLDDLLDMVGVDAARWYLLQRSADTHMDLDVAEARKQSAENPVYYVQYAHARIASVLRRAAVEPDAALPAGAELHPSERALVKALLAFPFEATDAAERRAPHRICAYALDTAQVFTAFYRDCQIIGADTEAFRLALALASQRVLARCLELLGISAPDEM
jgi:arginyl-tRNA synthetase